MNISILTIGDEICIGQIINTNAAWISSECALIGANIVAHSVVGDHIPTILSEFHRLLNLSDVLLITGGLGPTHDDRTKDALCQFLNDNLVFHQSTFDYLQQFFQSKGLDFTIRQQSQAFLPSKCQVLPNNQGTAPGILFNLPQNQTIVSMPGVPFEMKFIMRNSVLPILTQKMSGDGFVAHKTLLTGGIGEGNLADLVGNPDDFLQNSSLAFLPFPGGVRLRISTKANSQFLASIELNRIEKLLRERIGYVIYGQDDDNLASALGKLLINQHKTISVAESCTGGLLGGALTDMPGSSNYFIGGVDVYSYEAKSKILNIPLQIIQEDGAVSRRVAELLAQNCKILFSTDVALSITGIAGPSGGTIDKPVGTVWIGYADNENLLALKFNFGNSREINRLRSVNSALTLALKKLTKSV